MFGLSTIFDRLDSNTAQTRKKNTESCTNVRNRTRKYAEKENLYFSFTTHTANRFGSIIMIP